MSTRKQKTEARKARRITRHGWYSLSWGAPTKATPLSEMRKLQEHFKKHTIPINTVFDAAWEDAKKVLVSTLIWPCE